MQSSQQICFQLVYFSSLTQIQCTTHIMVCRGVLNLLLFNYIILETHLVKEQIIIKEGIYVIFSICALTKSYLY